jgi:hypothetical protein
MRDNSRRAAIIISCKWEGGGRLTRVSMDDIISGCARIAEKKTVRCCLRGKFVHRLGCDVGRWRLSFVRSLTTGVTQRASASGRYYKGQQVA